MSVDHATVRRIAHLARIAIDETEVAQMGDELNAILRFVEELIPRVTRAGIGRRVTRRRVDTRRGRPGIDRSPA